MRAHRLQEGWEHQMMGHLGHRRAGSKGCWGTGAAEELGARLQGLYSLYSPCQGLGARDVRVQGVQKE